jgi:hypothetical protein
MAPRHFCFGAFFFMSAPLNEIAFAAVARPAFRSPEG